MPNKKRVKGEIVVNWTYDTGPCDVVSCDIPNTDGVQIDIGQIHLFLCDWHSQHLLQDLLKIYPRKKK